jgi:hypothetical protein
MEGKMSDPAKLKSVVQGLVTDGVLTSAQADDLLSTNGGNLTAFNELAKNLHDQGVLAQPQYRNVIAAGGGNLV